MKIYLIDFENVKSKGLTGIDSLTEYDRVIIFYSENADTINFEMHQKVLISKAEVEYFKVHVGGKNALDFQLSTLLGYLVSKNYYSHIFVISNDKSFDFLHDFWHGKYIAAPDCVVYRTKTIAQAINYAGGKKQAVIEEDETDDTVFAAEPAAEVQETPAPAEVSEPAEKAVPLTVPAVEVKEEAPKAEPAAEEPKAEPVKEADAPADGRFTEKRAPRDKRTKAPRVEKKAAPAAEEEFTLSAEEVSALEASFGAYTIIKPEDVAPKAEEKPAAEEVKPAEKKADPAEKPAAEEKPASQKPAEKPKNKAVREFYPSLKEALKKLNIKPAEVNHISQLLINSDTKEEFHNALAKDYKQDATELYKLLRPKYLRLKEMYAAEHPEYVSPDTVVAAPAEVPAKAEEKPVEAKAEEKTAEVKAEEKPAEAKAEDKATEVKAEEKPEEKPAKAKRPGRPKKTAEDNKAEKAEKSAEEKPAKAKKSRSKKSEKNAEPAASGDRLAELLEGKCSSEELELIRQLFREVPTRQQLYIRMIKQFGKKVGCVYYNAIKAEYESLSEAIK
ncbi:PIN domain-containing protein [Ruminococcus sp.]|uniref:PIN domain-containing protein n=1 Tax=Ruminococcus sp. TaxID=41978 RepID=UPI0025F6E99D|nr:PIN domain-containing protein [Ruminococcus sp.]MBQ8966562.1 hypothetical protein [Ruminococcus sp.]